MDRLRGWARSWDDHEEMLSQAGVILLLVLAGFLFTRPLGLSGRGLLLLVVLCVNALVLVTRVLPDRVLGGDRLVATLVLGVLAAATLLALDVDWVAFVFAGFVAGHAGYRLRFDRALLVGGLASTSMAVALGVAPSLGQSTWPWFFGLLSGLPVFIGLFNRSRSATLRAAVETMHQTTRAAESEARERALAERARIARDIHDVLAHSLSGVNMQLELADALLEQGRVEQAQTAVSQARSLVKDGLGEARRAVYALREDALPLTQTLAAMLDGAELTLVGSPRPADTGVSQVLVRAAQEALSNARKYAPGAPVLMTVSFQPDEIWLEVCNGRSSADRPLADEGSGMGLIGMRERAALIGGRVEAGPVVDGHHRGGWRTCVKIPA